jgi:phosphoserine phosphatase
VVREAADASVNVPYLDAILFVLGVNRQEIEEAAAELGESAFGPTTPLTD